MGSGSSVKDKQEFIDLLKSNKGLILMICRAYAKDKEELEDCFQEVAIRLWQGFGSFRGEAQRSTWLYRVALNAAINFKRKEGRRPPTLQLLDVDLYCGDDSGGNANADRLYCLINRLELYEKALVMLWLENLSYAEIAEIMGLTVKNVSVKLARIKGKLKQLSKQNA